MGMNIGKTVGAGSTIVLLLRSAVSLAAGLLYMRRGSLDHVIRSGDLTCEPREMLANAKKLYTGV